MSVTRSRVLATIGASAALGVPFAAPASAQDGATFYANGEQAAFEQAAGARGLAVDLAEDFEDARPAPGFLGLPILAGPPTGSMNDPLDASTSNQFFKPGQIPARLRIQSNLDNDGGDGPNPAGAGGLAISRPSSAGEHATPTTISSPFGESGTRSTDVLSVNDAAHEAYVLDVSLVEFSFVEPGTDPIAGPLVVRVFDEAGASLGSRTIDQEEIGPFLGVVVPDGREIGRVNVSDETGGSELVHSVMAYDADGGNDTGTPTRASNPLADLLESLGLG